MRFHLQPQRRCELSIPISAEQFFRLAAVHRYKYYPRRQSTPVDYFSKEPVFESKVILFTSPRDIPCFD
jgi:hypothetical protein